MYLLNRSDPDRWCAAAAEAAWPGIDRLKSTAGRAGKPLCNKWPPPDDLFLRRN